MTPANESSGPAPDKAPFPADVDLVINSQNLHDPQNIGKTEMTTITARNENILRIYHFWTRDYILTAF